jgi:hypothetical protein
MSPTTALRKRRRATGPLKPPRADLLAVHDAA